MFDATDATCAASVTKTRRTCGCRGGLGTVSEIGTAAARPYNIIVGFSKSKPVLYSVPTGTRDLLVRHILVSSVAQFSELSHHDGVWYHLLNAPGIF